MIRLTINLPKHRLQIRFVKARKRANGPSFLPNLNIIRGFRAGNKLSRFFRHILERANIKTFLGGNLALFVVVLGILTPIATAIPQIEPDVATLPVPSPPLSTEVVIQYPVNPVIVNQGFHLFHWGVDLDGVKGDPIRPIMKGRVVRVEKSRFLYGNSVRIEHEGNLASFYAHLSEIDVKENDQVETRTIIGKVGSTGRSTGDHLHLEIYKNGRPVNPFSILPKR